MQSIAGIYLLSFLAFRRGQNISILQVRTGGGGLYMRVMGRRGYRISVRGGGGIFFKNKTFFRN